MAALQKRFKNVIADLVFKCKYMTMKLTQNVFTYFGSLLVIVIGITAYNMKPLYLCNKASALA